MLGQCFRKCVSQFAESDLQKGEAACVERCVKKYSETQLLVRERALQIQQTNQQQQQQIAQLQTPKAGGRFGF
jgi:import inner membrane translocase subunit TIM10